TFLGETHLATKRIGYSRKTQNESQAKGVRTLLRQGYCLIVLHLPLVRIAQVPERPSSMATAYHAIVLPIEERRGAMLLGIVERYALYQVRECRGLLSHEGQRRPQGTARSTKHGNIPHPLCERQELFTQLLCRPILGTHGIITVQATQHGEKLVRIVQVFTEVL